MSRPGPRKKTNIRQDVSPQAGIMSLNAHIVFSQLTKSIQVALTTIMKLSIAHQGDANLQHAIVCL